MKPPGCSCHEKYKNRGALTKVKDQAGCVCGSMDAVA